MNDEPETIKLNEEDFGSLPQETKSPKVMLIDFVKHTSGDKKLFTFNHPGNVVSAKKYIHRMRVELSRFRAKIINQQNKKPVPFKIFKKDLIFNAELNVTTVTLFRGEEKPLSQEMDELLDSISIDPQNQE